MKIAIVHDYLNQYGGAEKVVEALHELYPEAPIYTSFYIPKNLPDRFRKMKIITSFMNSFPGIERHYKKYFMFYPFSFGSFNLSGYDLIISSSSAYAKGVKKPTGSVHICYCYTPARFIWRYWLYIEKENISLPMKAAIKFFTHFLKRWDVSNSGGVDHFVAISNTIRERIQNIYERDSVVIYPPVETKKFKLSATNGNYYLVVSRLNAYKRIDIVIKAFNQLGIPLRVIGEGSHAQSLRKMAGPNIEFLGRCSNEEVIDQVSRCRALIFPGEEDFGIAPVEAQAAGRPVVAYAAGGALETLVDGVTGVFFHEQTPVCVEAAVRELENKITTFNPKTIRENAVKFDKDVFMEQLKSFVLSKYEHSKRN